MRAFSIFSRTIRRLPSQGFPHTRRSFSFKPQRGNDDEKNYFLKRLRLNGHKIFWPETNANDIEKADYWHTNPHSIQAMYGNSDVSGVPIFKGGYINFGCWPDIDDKKIDNSKRIEASERLYQAVTDDIDLGPDSRVVDVGCGTGYGCQYLMRRYYPEELTGLDITPEQIERAKKYHGSMLSMFPSERFKFVVGDALSMPFPNNSLTHVISVEAAQHFSPLERFIKESRRVLEPSGKLVFTTFFAAHAEGRAAVRALIPDYATHCNDLLVGEVTETLIENLRAVQVKSIGRKVWPGLEKWLNQIGFQNQWTVLWPALYKAGFIDYFVFQAEAPRCDDTDVLEESQNFESSRSTMRLN